MSMEESEHSFVKTWVNKLCNGECSTLREFIESVGSEIKNSDHLIRENAVRSICLVISELPQIHAWRLPQVDLLLDFFQVLYDVHDAADCSMLTAVKNLMKIGPHLKASFIQCTVEKLFHQSQVQTLAQKERYISYQILDILLNKYHKELSDNVYFVSYFISSVSGERDPRCLIIVFRLFCIVCNHFKSEKFPRNLFDIHASDLFDIVACYYPVEFKESSRHRTGITRDLLVSGCESCLLADEEFGPFVFHLIIEKITDDEYSVDIKLEVCAFLAKACATFPVCQLNDHVDELCAGIRSMLPDMPKSTNPADVPESITIAVSSMLKALAAKKLRIEHICQEFTENCEIFVLQAELGLTGRFLSFFEILIKASEFAVDITFENVFSWLLSLCKGDSANFANRPEIIDDNFKFLFHWIDLAFQFKKVKLMENYSTKFIELLDKYDREIVQLTRYKLMEVANRMHLRTHELLENCKVLLIRSFNLAWSENVNLRNSCLSFVHAFAEEEWTVVKVILASEIDAGIFQSAPLLWSAVHNAESLDFALLHLDILFPATLAWSSDYQEIFIQMFKWNKFSSSGLQGALLKQTLMCCFMQLELVTDSVEKMDSQAKFLQKIGLIVDERTHHEGLDLIEKKLTNFSILLPGLYLYIIQSTDSDRLLSIGEQLSSSNSEMNWYKSLILAAAVNKSSDYILTLNIANNMQKDLHPIEILKWKCRLCAVLLLRGYTEGYHYFKELLHDLVEHYESADAHIVMNAVMDTLTFNKCYSDPLKCKYQKTLLWQQRIFCQLVSVCVKYFNDLESSTKRMAIFALLSPLFTLAETSAALFNDKYVELLPVLCAALDTSRLDASLEELIISSLAKLLENATPKQLSDDFLLKILPRLQHSLEKKEYLKVQLVSLECLHLVAKRWPSETLLPYYRPIVCSLITTSKSQKKIVRRAVAVVRNLWELLPTK